MKPQHDLPKSFLWRTWWCPVGPSPHYLWWSPSSLSPFSSSSLSSSPFPFSSLFPRACVTGSITWCPRNHRVGFDQQVLIVLLQINWSFAMLSLKSIKLPNYCKLATYRKDPIAMKQLPNPFENQSRLLIRLRIWSAHSEHFHTCVPHIWVSRALSVPVDSPTLGETPL